MAADLTAVEQAYWEKFQKAAGIDAHPIDVFAFGDSAEMADELLALVLTGTKQATACRLAMCKKYDLPIANPGDLSIVRNGRGDPACIIQTVRVDLVPFDDVSAEFARIEGEGDGSLDYWRSAHLDYFTRECAREGDTFSTDELIMCEQFKMIWSA